MPKKPDPAKAKPMAKKKETGHALQKALAAERTDTSPAHKLYDKLVAETVSGEAGVQASRMFGMPCLKVRGKMFAGYWQEAMVFKLKGDTHQAAIGLKGARLFDPSNMNRPMKEWVVVPYAHRTRWRELTQAALAYVSGSM